jgi:uncharacterized 2Fe-2S/4Fe-4S cluster protein (DUF4445 family)
MGVLDIDFTESHRTRQLDQHTNSTHHPSMHRLVLMPSGRQGDVAAGMTVLDAARQLGVELAAICGSRQTCGKCLVNVESGSFPKHGITSNNDHLSEPSQREQDYAEKHGLDLSTQRLGCNARITGDVLITVPENSLAHKQVIRKAAGELTVEVAPAMRLVVAEVSEAVLGGPSDWSRLQTALAEQWQLTDLTLDARLLTTLQPTLRKENGTVTVTLWQDREIVRIEPGYVDSLYGVAVDVGSTTVAMYLCDLQTGAVLATDTMMNPQVRYGEDLVSRISYAAHEEQGSKRLHQSVIGALNKLAGNVAESAGIDPTEITDVVLVGNTVMHHILLGLNPVELGHLPFALATDAAIDLKARDLGINAVHEAAQVHLLPCIAGYVGADNVAVLLAEYPDLDKEQITLVVDIGTNAEILLFGKGKILSASSPTGPALEGAQIKHGQRAAAGAIERIRIRDGQPRYKVIGDERWNDELNPGESLRPTGICGSGIIEVVAELFTDGVIVKAGRFVKEAEEHYSRVRRGEKGLEFVLATAEETATDQDIVITQRDIRSVQLAKGGLYAGVRLLMDALEVDQVDHIRLAGAFGSYIDPLYAMQIGLIPDCDLSQVVSAGNVAGDGARVALLNWEQRRNIQQIVHEVEYVETAAKKIFQDMFIDALALPHQNDPFPNLEQFKAGMETA